MSKEIIKNKFKNGMIPDENDFGELIDFIDQHASDFNNFSTNPIFQDGKLMSVEEYEGATLIRRTTLNYGADNTVNSVITETPNKKMTTALTFENNTLSNVKNTVSTGGL